MLFLVGNHTSIALALCSLARKCEVELITGSAIMQGDDIMVYTTITLLVYIDIAYSNILSMRLFKTIKVERGIITYISL